MTMSKWIYALKTILKCEIYTSKELREIILDECLFTRNKSFGFYVVDGNKVWNRIVVHDLGIMERLDTLNIYDYIGIESLCHSVLEQKARVINTKNCRKRNRRK